MILSQDYLKQLKNNQLKNHTIKLIKIQKQYFGLDSHAKVMGKYKGHKTFQTIVNLCFNILRYVLFQSEKTEFINMKAHVEVEEQDIRSVSSNARSSKGSSYFTKAFGVNQSIQNGG